MARNVGSDQFHLNEFIADHLAERGYSSTLRSFKNDVKNDKTSSVDSFVDYLMSCITNLNFQGLIDVWNEMDKRLFSRLHAEHATAAHQLEARLLKLFMVTALLRNSTKKAQDCLEYMANSSRLSNDPDLRDWFRVPYIKSPETDPLTAKYCSKFWQDTLAVSLYNFISSVYHTSASNLQHQRMKAQNSQENGSATDAAARLRPRKLQDTFGRPGNRDSAPPANNLQPTSQIRSKFNRAMASMNTKSQFHFSGDSASGGNTKPAEAPRPEAEPLIVSTRPSPQLARKLRPRQHSSASESSTLDNGRLSPTGSSSSLAGIGPLSPRSGRASTPDRVSQMKWQSPNHSVLSNYSGRDTTEILFHLVCEEDFGSHDSAIVDCVFSSCGTKVASFDVKGCVKVWRGLPPATKLISTFQSSSRLTYLRWTQSDDDLLVIGDERGNVSLLDGANGTLVMEISIGSAVTSLAVSSDGENKSYLACGSNGSEESHYGVFVIDIATFTIRSELRHASLMSACNFHSKKSLLICGFNTGEICEFNPKFQKFSSKLAIHSGIVHQVEYLEDEAFCVSAGGDGKMIISHLALGGRKLAEIILSLSDPQVLPPFRRCFSLNYDGSMALVKADDGIKIFKMTGPLASNFSLDKLNAAVSSMDWCAQVRDKSTGILGYTNGKIRWFRLLHLA